MKKVKIAIWIIVLGFVVLIVTQNWSYFNTKQQLNVNLYFEKYHTLEFSNLLFFLACFLIGLLIAYFYGLVERFRSNKLIKRLNETTAAQQEEISGLKRELELMQKRALETQSEPTNQPSRQ